jgi:transcriptional regulator with XRE-family HTH domain
MQEKCIKQSLLARKAGLGVQEFSSMMTGRKIIRPEHLARIAKALDVTTDELLMEVENAGQN